MAAKTAAELQMEFLKKLKEQQSSGKIARLSPPSASPSPKPKVIFKPRRRAKKKSIRGIVFSASAQTRLRHGLKDRGLDPKDKSLGDWAVDLILGTPAAARSLNETFKDEFFQAMRDWCDSKGIK